MKIISVETDRDAPAECPSSDSEAPVNEDLELVCPEEEQTLTPALSTEPITTEVLAVKTDVEPPTSNIETERAGDAVDMEAAEMAADEPPYDEDDREVAFIFGSDDETVRR